MDRISNQDARKFRKALNKGIVASLKKRWYIHLTILMLTALIMVYRGRYDVVAGLTKLFTPIFTISAVTTYDNRVLLESHYDSKNRRLSFGTVIVLNFAVALVAATGATLLLTWNHRDITRSAGYRKTFRSSNINACVSQMPDSVQEQHRKDYCICSTDAMIQSVGERVYTKEFTAEFLKNGLDEKLVKKITDSCASKLEAYYPQE